ncbi:unnamed protein product [Absidia cylindrospora]
MDISVASKIATGMVNKMCDMFSEGLAFDTHNLRPENLNRFADAVNANDGTM